MIEALQNLAISTIPQRKASTDQEQQPSNIYGEVAALSAGIQRLATDRDKYRTRVDDLERDNIRLRALNDEIRKQSERVGAVRDHYMRLATELLAHLKQVDVAIHEIVEKTVQRDELVTLAQRLSPAQATASKPAEKR